ncbi:hypothetical protein GH714_011328 [Hevea brasiliensis]|uniref:Uncharacterized protein n=1 Tax=Hevea brasiliensis TaxID=3981 RepID=A0A6A6M4L7_HEVBR|nr:hypothetical protein GH714_011328 [Hevea brasiliensis]
MDVDCLQVIKHEVYQENEVDSIEIKEDELHLLLRINVDPEDIESLLISKLPEGDEDDNFIDDVETDDLDDPLVFYVNSDDIQNTLDDEDDLRCLMCLASTSRKRGRGQTMGKGLMKTIAVMGTRMKITVNPEIGQPNNGDESA